MPTTLTKTGPLSSRRTSPWSLQNLKDAYSFGKGVYDRVQKNMPKRAPPPRAPKRKFNAPRSRQVDPKRKRELRFKAPSGSAMSAAKFGKSSASSTTLITHSDLKVGYSHDKASMCISTTNIPFMNCPVEDALVEFHSGSIGELSDACQRGDGFYVETISNNGKSPTTLSSVWVNVNGSGAAGSDWAQYAPTWPVAQETKYSPVWLPDMAAIGIYDDTPTFNKWRKPSEIESLRVQNSAIYANRRLFKSWRVPLVSVNIRWNGPAPLGWYRVFEGFKERRVAYVVEKARAPDTGTGQYIQTTTTVPYNPTEHRTDQISFFQKEMLSPQQQLEMEYGRPMWQYGQYGDITDPTTVQPANPPGQPQPIQPMEYPAKWNLSPGYFPALAGTVQVGVGNGGTSAAPAEIKQIAWLNAGRRPFMKETFRKDRKWRRIPSSSVFDLKIKLTNQFVDTNKNLNTGPPPIIIFGYDGDDQWKSPISRTVGFSIDPSTKQLNEGVKMAESTMLETVTAPGEEAQSMVIGRMDVVYCVDFQTRQPSYDEFEVPPLVMSKGGNGQVNAGPLASEQAFKLTNPLFVFPIHGPAGKFTHHADVMLSPQASNAPAASDRTEAVYEDDGTTPIMGPELYQYARNHIQDDELGFTIPYGGGVVHYFSDADYSEENHIVALGSATYKRKFNSKSAHFIRALLDNL